MLRHPTRPGTGPMVALGLCATLLVHGALGVALLIGRGKGGAHPLAVAGHFVDVQAVRFGRPRDLSFLPHKAPPKVAEPPPKLALTSNERALPRLKPPEEEKKPVAPVDEGLERLKALARKLDTGEEGATGSRDDEGDPHGIVGGTATEGRGPVYYQHLQAAVQNAWTVPTTISDAELGRLSAQACIKINLAGKIVEYKLAQSSGNERFDLTLLQAVDRIRDFEPPTAEVREAVTGAGVCMNFKFAKNR